MDFVFHHQSQPFPPGDFGVVRRLALALKVLVAELREDFHGLGVQSLHESGDVFIGACQLFSMSGVSAWPTAHRLRPNPALCYGKVTQQIAEGEFARCARPIDFLRGNAARHAHGALAHIAKVMKEWLNGAYFHESSQTETDDKSSPHKLPRANRRHSRTGVEQCEQRISSNQADSLGDQT